MRRGLSLISDDVICPIWPCLYGESPAEGEDRGGDVEGGDCGLADKVAGEGAEGHRE